MISLQRSVAGLYLTGGAAEARLVFLFRNAEAAPETFQLDAKSWISDATLGCICFVAPSATRDWGAFAAMARAFFGANASAQIAWFFDDGRQPVAILVAQQTSAAPRLSQSFSLVFRRSLTFRVARQFDGSTKVLFDDAANALVIAPAQAVQMTMTPPSGAARTLASTAPAATIALTGPLAGTITAPFALAESDLAQLEAGIMFFEQPAGELVRALRYPLLRAPEAGLSFGVVLDVLAPLDGSRTFFGIQDAEVASYFAFATGRLARLAPSLGSDGAFSRFVLADRPQTGPEDANYYYLAPAGTYRLVGPAGRTTALAETTGRLLCGVTGTEFVRVALGQAPDALDFVPGQPAWRPPSDPTSVAPIYLDARATTSWVRLLTRSGAYVAQPERAPLFAQTKRYSAAASPFHLLDFAPTDVWRPSGAAAAEVEGPLAPLVPYAALAFATDPSLDAGAYRDMERCGLNPTRARAYGISGKIRMLRQQTAESTKRAMTPQGMVVGLAGDPEVWDRLEIAVSHAVPPVLAFEDMGSVVQKAVQTNQIFVALGRNPAITPALFGFKASRVTIGDWTFDLSPAGIPAADGTPPIFIMKFYPDQSIRDLVDEVALWADPDAFCSSAFTALEAQAYIKALIVDAEAAVHPHGTMQAPDGDSIYANFYEKVTDPDFNGILALNCNMRLEDLPPAIRAVLGGMKPPQGIEGFRVHHVGIAINDTDPEADEPTLSQSSMFALVDYEGVTQPPAFPYDIEVEYLRALFTNSELSDFECKLNVTIGKLFDTEVALAVSGKEPHGNVISLVGSYQKNDDGDDDGSGGAYAFLSEEAVTFECEDGSRFLESISFEKIQFVFVDETELSREAHPSYVATKSRVRARFGIWGSIAFKETQVLDLFSFSKLVFADLGITVGFDLTVNVATSAAGPPPPAPRADELALSFAPGDLRLDIEASEAREGQTSLLRQLPFKLRSFLYSEAGTKVDTLGFYSLGAIPLPAGLSLEDSFNYALVFSFDLGSLGRLVSSAAAFRFDVLVGWQSGADGGVAVAVALPQIDGKLEIKIEGVITISIDRMNLEYARTETPKMLVLALQDCFIEVLGKRMPPGEGTISLALFAPTEGADKIGWIGAYKKGEDDVRTEDGKVFELDYLGLGQRVGPDPTDPPEDFQQFLDYMRDDFWSAIKTKDYSDIYHADGRWLALTHFTLLGKVEIGFVFYDETPFYSLLIAITVGKAKGFSFEITYTKVNESIGLFSAKIVLPDTLRKFEVGAASLTLPNLGIGVYTNGNWKVDVGFPEEEDDWEVCFRVEAMAGPVPVTGSGGFYIASLSSATDPDVFVGDYRTILAFGFAARLGVGKDFTAGPLKAGVSVTFFGIIQGAAGYLTAGQSDIFQKPDALALAGQFGIIGELYGSVDFLVIKASVNVRLQASIGIVLAFEPSQGRDGSILLYIEASVEVSVTLTIDLFLFSISVTYSFRASFRFDWQLAGSHAESHQRLAFVASLAAMPRAAARPVPLCPGLTTSLPLLYLPEITVVFADAHAEGQPWFVVSLALPFDHEPKLPIAYADLKPFERVATQLTTFALVNALGLADYASEVFLDSDPARHVVGLKELDSQATLLTGGIDYASILEQLALFAATIAVPTGKAGDPTLYTSLFPMPPFLTLTTNGRDDAFGKPDDLTYSFADKNGVTKQYLELIEAYFEQLFVNRTSDSTHARLFASRAAEPRTPLSQEIFLDYCKGLIRGAVHELLVTLQTLGTVSSALDKLIIATVARGGFAALAGQMSSIARGGVRLPYTDGLTVPDGAALTTTNPLYSLLWQQFPVGAFRNGASYTIHLVNTDASQPWLKADAAYSLTNDDHGVAPYRGLHESDVTKPGNPRSIGATEVGPRAFAFRNAIVWTTTDSGTTTTICPFPSSLVELQAQVSRLTVAIKSRPLGGAYLPAGTPLPDNAFAFATKIDLTVKRIPAASATDDLRYLAALSGASQADEALLGLLLDTLSSTSGLRTLAKIELLYPAVDGPPGLRSAPIDPTQVFLLRTNTTDVSQPPPGVTALRGAPREIAVGADFDLARDGGLGLVQIIQQATVTNAPGYVLRYADSTGQPLDPALFKSGAATISILLTCAEPNVLAPYHNAILLRAPPSAKGESRDLVYAETVDPALATRYAALAAGTAGVTLTRSDAVSQLKVSAELAGLAGTAGGDRQERSALLQATGRSAVDVPADRLRALLLASGAVPAALNKLYSLVAYRTEATAGFIASNLSTSMQPQRPLSGDVSRTYRLVCPLYNLAIANQGRTHVDRYASIGQPYALTIEVLDAFGNALPSSIPFAGTNVYFDGLIPLDQWTGIVTSYDFAVAGYVSLHLTPSEVAFTGLSDDERAAAKAHLQTIADQIHGLGTSFFVETSLAMSGSDAFAILPLPEDASTRIRALVDALIAWFDGAQHVFPGRVDVDVAVPASPLPPAFALEVLFGIAREPSLVDPEVRRLFPSAEVIASSIPPALAGATDIRTFATQFTTAFPALRMAAGLTGTSGGLSRLKRARRMLRGVSGTGGQRSKGQALWAVAASLLAITIGARSVPRYMAPKPLDNVLRTDTVPLPSLDPKLGTLPKKKLFADIDLDQLNRLFFQTVDSVLTPDAAAKAFALSNDHALYDRLARGRETLARKYARHEVEWLFEPASPFSGTEAQLRAGRDVFEQQMRRALMSAYVIDAIVQYDVDWQQAVSPAAAGRLELFGTVEAVVHGTYAINSGVLAATTRSPHGLSVGDAIDGVFVAAAGGTAPKSRLYTIVAPVTPTTFHLAVEGTGEGTFTAAYQSSGLSTAHVAIESGGSSALTFTYASANVSAEAIATLDLRYAVTHLQLFLAPQGASLGARPSLWLELAEPLRVHIGPDDAATQIPVVFRQFPQPPSIAAQGWTPPQDDPHVPNPIAQAAGWVFNLTYQASLAAQDRLNAALTYNTDLRVVRSTARSAEEGFSLFQALARFAAVQDLIAPMLANRTQSNWGLSVEALANCLREVETNTDWRSPPFAVRATTPTKIVDSYAITDQVRSDQSRLIKAVWPQAQGQSSFAGAALFIEELDASSPSFPAPTSAYPAQVRTIVADGIEIAVPNVGSTPGVLIAHHLSVTGLNVLAAENAIGALSVERNRIALPSAPNDEIRRIFVYRTAAVRPSQPVTPFIDRVPPPFIDVASLPRVGGGGGCPASESSLCRRVRTILMNLLADHDQARALRGARDAAGLATSTIRRVKVVCSYQFAMNAAAGGTDSTITPQVPIVLARSFDIDDDVARIDQVAVDFSQAVADWARGEDIVFGPQSVPLGAALLFDVTLYAALSGLNTPVLRLANLWLALADVDPT